MVMEHPDVQWTWLHVIFCSSIIQTTAVSLHAKSDLSSGGNTIYIYSTKAVHVGNSNPPGSSPQSLPEISSKVSAHEEPDPPIHSGMSPLYLSASSRGNSSDFSGDDEDLVFDDEDLVFNSEDNSNIEEVKQDITESQAFILGNGSVPSVISADTNSSSDYSLLKPFNSTSVYKSTQSVQNPKHSQGSGTVHDISFLQHSTATFPNDDLFFEVNSHHMTLPHTETMQTTPRPLVALGNMNPTLTSDHLVTEKPYFITTSYVSPGEETPVPEIKRNHDQVLTPLVIESSAKWPQDFVSKKLSVNHMSPAPMRSASPLITGSSYSAMMSEKLLIVSRPAADVSELHNRTDTFSRANTIDANAQFFAQRASNSVEHLPKLTTTPASERQVRWQTTDRAYPRVKVLSATDRMSTSQWVRMSAYDTDKFLPSQQTTQTYFTSEQGNDIYTNPVDSSATVIEMVEDPQFLDGQPTNTKQGSVVRGSFPNGLATISPTARLQHLTLKGNRNVLSSIEPTRVVTTTYFSPLTAWRHGPSREPNSAIESAKTESIPSGRYMAMLKTRPTVLTQQLTAKISNKTNVSVTLPPLTQGGLGTKSISTTLSLPRATTKVPLPSSRPTKVSIAETTMKGGPVKVGVKPPFKDTVTEGTLPSATRTPGNHYNVITTVTAVTRSQSGNDTQTPTMKIASNTSTGVNTTSPKGQDTRNGPGRKWIIPNNAQMPNHTVDSKMATGNHSDKISSHFELCSTLDRDCAFNKTFTQWKQMKQTLGFAWEMHIYGAGVLFVILIVISLINLIGSPILAIPDLHYLMAANAMLFALALLRAVYLFLDPYGSKFRLPLISGLMLYNITFPLLITTFGILTLLLLKMGDLQMLSSKFQNPTTLSMIAAVHFIVLISGDLLYLLVNPAVNVVLHVFSVSWASFLITAFFLSYRKLQSHSEATVQQIQKPVIGNEEPVEPQNHGRTLKQLLLSTKVMAISAAFGFLCCAFHVYATLWNYGLLGEKGQFYWAWWFVQFWYRSFEIAMSFAMSFVASYAFCQQHARPDHTCWRKIVQYFHQYRKNEVPEYPNNCFDWSSGAQDRITGNDIFKNLIHNRPESMPLKTINGTNQEKPAKSYYNNNGSIISLDHRPKIPVLGPKSHNLLLGRSFTSICIEKESSVSLNEFDLRPPSPINLSRSIDEALFREHIVRDSLFNDSGLQCPSHMTIEDSRSSLRVHKVSDQGNVTVVPLDFRRRNSDPDYLHSVAKSSSLSNNQTDTSKQSVQDIDSNQASSRLHRSASGSSVDSISRTSFGIHWYTWTRERSSEESAPSADPVSESLLSQDNPEVNSNTEDFDLEAKKSFIDVRVTDDVSLSSDTIEL
ncbi:uncharacterized protein LOC132378059 isoform X1 [Hypanus sabinus]|uniref:uncharacterized protein LOC132378059 isoform X1 n=1 Tax=Hypanus sabinus TaxID=79690 RepID=UPI0028C46050|nr:uncharacterized protein LOC132378059 isoform X1 [Hypanus sabinus]XP_059800709.1 uncharacterized protein LOC132378059 isoform X1 [Hypanus sabinus]